MIHKAKLAPDVHRRLDVFYLGMLICADNEYFCKIRWGTVAANSCFYGQVNGFRSNASFQYDPDSYWGIGCPITQDALSAECKKSAQNSTIYF